MMKEKEKQRIQKCKEQGLSKKATARKLKCNIKTIRKYWDGGGIKQISGAPGHGNLKTMESPFRLEEIETVPCNNCGTMLEIHLTEKQVKCPKCDHLFNIERSIKIPCPDCGTILVFFPGDEAKVVCPKCNRRFVCLKNDEKENDGKEEDEAPRPYKYKIKPLEIKLYDSYGRG